jgi:hypothetical protein
MSFSFEPSYGFDPNFFKTVITSMKADAKIPPAPFARGGKLSPPFS